MKQQSTGNLIKQKERGKNMFLKKVSQSPLLNNAATHLSIRQETSSYWNN